MTAQIVDFSQIDQTGKVQWGSENIGSIYYNGERLWPFGVDLLYTGGIDGASYLPDPADVFANHIGSSAASFSGSVGLIWDERNGTPVLGPELVVNGDFATDTAWSKVTATISDGQATLQANGSVIQSVIPLETGRWFQITVTVVSTAGAVVVFCGTNSSTDARYATQFATAGTRTFLLQSAGATNTIRFGSNAAGVSVIDNVSVREVSGHHAFQTSAALRPLLGRAPKAGRRNLLTRTEEFNHTDWLRAGLTVTANAAIAPDGSNTANLIIEDGSTGGHSLFRLGAFASGTNIVRSVYMKAGTRSRAVLAQSSALNVPGFGYIVVDLNNGSVVSSLGAGGIAQPVGNDWYRVILNSTLTGPASDRFVIGIMRDTDTAPTSYTGDGSGSIYVWGAQGEVGSTVTAYQRVGFSGDVSEYGVPSYPFIRFDLSDDVLTTGTLGQKNLLQSTEEFDNSIWIKTTSSIAANVATAPDGTITADKLIANSGNVVSQTNQVVATSAVSYVFSVYAKAAEFSQIQLSNDAVTSTAYFDLMSGTVGNTVNATSSITNAGNGWYRCSMLFTNTLGTPRHRIYIASGSSTTVTGNGVDGILIWGAQLEIGSAVTAYEYGGFSGDIIVAGRNGSAFTSSVKVPDGTVSLGTTSYTGGTPGILRAVGDVVGWSIIAKTLTSAERERLMRFYKRRGAKGLLVPGSNLVNGWLTSTAGWTQINLTSFSSNGQSLSFVTSQPTSAGIWRGLSFSANVPYLIEMSGTNTDFLVSTNGLNGNPWFRTDRSNFAEVLIYASTATLFIGFSKSATINSLSVRELRPEEDW